MSVRILFVFAAMAAIVGLPFVFKPRTNLLARADETLVVITPHNEAIRYEFARAFAGHFRELTGRTVRIDWRMPGGTSEIGRYLKSEFFAAFQNEWTSRGHSWTHEVEATFDNPKAPADAPARAAFLSSDVGIGIDVFFGGGAYDFQIQAEAGRLVDSGVLAARAEWFNDASIPAVVSGEPFYDPRGRWIGACLSSFGMCYNSEVLDRLGVSAIPASWSDLANPKFFKQVALADPTKSGSAAKAFEMIIQQQMGEAVARAGAGRYLSETERAVAEGWLSGLRLIQHASANARYFTDAAGKVPIDVSLGDAAIGMCIDFYGRFQSEEVKLADGSSRLQYLTPVGGSSVGTDPIGLLRGASNRDVAVKFIEFVLSIEGQKLWNFTVGAPGGPVKYALRRLPIRKELYAAEFADFRSDPEVFPYEEARLFTYHPEWTGALFKALSFIVRVMSLDTHDEQVAAWKAMKEAGFPPEAMARFSDLSAVDYDAARTVIRPALSSSDRIAEVRLAKDLGDRFRAQYRDAKRLAEEGR
jgi:ABC-type Fe3+ transport system substrate-binding protein